MTQRLHHVREHTFRMRVDQWRRMSEDKGERPPAFLAADMGEELLYEIEMLRADLAAERAETARLKAELADVVAWLYKCGDFHGGADLSAMVERGDHVRSPGTPPPGAPKDPA